MTGENERVIRMVAREEILVALRKMKDDKGRGVGGIAEEMLKMEALTQLTGY